MVTPTSRPDHVALFFGASRGIGAATAQAFAERGAQVCLVARSPARLETVRGSLKSRGHDAWINACDITDLTSVQATVKAVLDTFGQIDTIVDFAASTGPLNHATWEVSPDQWNSTIATNLSGVYHVLHACVPPMLHRRQGKLLFASSPFGDMVTPGLGAYPTSRAGGHALVYQAASELQGTGVSASILHPGITETEGLADFRRARGGGADFGAAVPPAMMANLFVWAALQPPEQINGQVLSWSDNNVRTAALMLPPG